MAEQTLILGTLFKGKLDPSYKRHLVTMKRLVRGVGNEFTKTGNKTTRAAAKVKQFNNATRQGTAPIRKYGGAMTNLGGAFKTVLMYGAAGTVIMGVTQALRAGLSEIIQYDQALKNLEAISGATTLELEIMGLKIKDVANTTKFSTREIGQGMVTITQAGFDATEAVQTMSAVADLATGTLTSLTTVSDLLTTTLRAFGLNALESGRAADVMANAVNKSKLTVDKLRIAFNFAGAASAQAGLSVEQTAASMMVLANNGLRASTIGTGFRQVLKRLIAPNEKLRDAYVSAGVALESLTIDQTQSYEQVLRNITAVLFDAESGTVDMAKAFTLFGLRGSQAVAILVKEFQSGKFNEALKKTFAVGTAAKMAGIQFKGLEVSIKNLKDKWGLLFVALGEGGLKTAMEVIVKIAKVLVGVMADLAKSGLGSAVIQAGILSGAIWGTVKAIQALTKAAQALAVTQFFKSIMAARGLSVLGTGGWGLLAIAIGTVTVATYKLLTATGRANDALAIQAQEAHGSAISLESYAGALRAIQEKLGGADASIAIEEYSALLQRLKTDHKELAPEIDDSAEALGKNLEVVEKLGAEKNAEAFKKLAEATRNFAKAEREAAISGGLLNIAMKSGKWYIDTYKKVLSVYPALLKATASGISSLSKETIAMIDGIDMSDIRADTPLHAAITTLKSMSSAAKATAAGVTSLGDSLVETGEKTNLYAKEVEENRAWFQQMAEYIRIVQKAVKGTTIDDYLDANKIKLNADQYKYLQAEMLKVLQTEKDLEATRKKNDEANARFKKLSQPKAFGYAKSLAKDQGEIGKLRAIRDSTESEINRRAKQIQAQSKLDGIAEVEWRKEIEAMKLRVMQKSALEYSKVLSSDELTMLKEKLRSIKIELDKLMVPKLKDRDKSAIATLKEDAVATKAKITELYEEFKRLISVNTTLTEADLTFMNAIVNQADKAIISFDKVDVKAKETFQDWDRMFVDVGNSLVDNIANGFGEIASGADSMADRFQTMAQRMIQDMIALIAKVLLLKALLATTGGWTGGSFMNKFAQAGLGSLGFGAPVAKIASTAVTPAVASIGNKMTSGTVNSTMPNMSTPTSTLKDRSLNNNSNGNVQIIKIDAVDAKSFNQMLASKSAQQIFVSSVLNNKNHNGIARGGA